MPEGEESFLYLHAHKRVSSVPDLSSNSSFKSNILHSVRRKMSGSFRGPVFSLTSRIEIEFVCIAVCDFVAPALSFFHIRETFLSYRRVWRLYSEGLARKGDVCVSEVRSDVFVNLSCGILLSAWGTFFLMACFELQPWKCFSTPFVSLQCINGLVKYAELDDGDTVI